MKDLKQRLEDCVNAERDIKSGRMDMELCLEQLIIRQCSGLKMEGK
jgi:DNA polymerase III delta subunit